MRSRTKVIEQLKTHKRRQDKAYLLKRKCKQKDCFLTSDAPGQPNKSDAMEVMSTGLPGEAWVHNNLTNA